MLTPKSCSQATIGHPQEPGWHCLQLFAKSVGAWMDHVLSLMKSLDRRMSVHTELC